MKKLLLILFLTPLLAGAQLLVDPLPYVDSVRFPTNEYICLSCNGQSSYPAMRHPRFNSAAMDTANMLKAEDYGVKGDGSTLDNAAILKIFADPTVWTKGVRFKPANYLINKQIIINVPLGVKVKVWAVGATFKMADLSRYSMFYFIAPSIVNENYASDIVWVGGKIDGNQYNQKYPYNPHGGIYDSQELEDGVGDDKWWEEDHGSLILVDNFRYAVFYKVQTANKVMDGISIRKSYLGTIAYCKDTGSADLRYKFTGEQGTAFKVTRNGYKYCYFLNDTTYGGSIGIFASWKEGEAFDTTTTIVIKNFYSLNAQQNSVHIEDAARSFLDSITAITYVNNEVYPQILFSNESRVISVQNSTFRNQPLNASNGQKLRIALINNCNITTDIPAGNSLKIKFHFNSFTHISNSYVSGIADTASTVFYVHNTVFENYGTKNYAVRAVYMIDSSTFRNAKYAANFRNGNSGRNYYNTYQSITTPNTNYTPSGDWQAPWRSGVRMKIRGRIREIKAK